VCFLCSGWICGIPQQIRYRQKALDERKKPVGV
jgi:hypothetical protein